MLPWIHPKEQITSWSPIVTLGHKQRERRQAGAHLRKHSRLVDCSERVETVRESERDTRLMWRACFDPHMPDSSGCSEPKLPHIAIDFLQLRSPLLHCPRSRAASAIAVKTGRHFPPSSARLDCKKSFRNSGGNASGLSTILRQKTAMPLPKSFRSMLVRMMG